jgi:hypothetical protein
VGIVWGFLSSLFKYTYRFTLRIPHTVQVDFGCPAVFMTQDSLDGTQWHTVAIHYGRTRMPDRVKPEITDPGFLA